ITELVERIRAAGDESHLVFIFPSQARVLLSPLNLRLLQQYSRSNLKSTAIVSGDPRVQGLAREAGFATYASVQAYERGVPVMRPATDDADGDGVAAAGAADLAAEAVDDTWADPVAAALPPGRRRPRGALPGTDRRRLYMVAGAIFVLGFLLLFLVAPSAKVTITLKATPVELSKQIQGTSDPSSAQGPDRVLTKAVTDDESQQFSAKPTGQKQIQAVAATGGIVLTTDEPFPFCASNGFPRGTEFSTAGAKPVRFVVSQDTTNTPDGQYCVPAATAGAPVSSSPPIAVTAEATGTSGNVPAGSITQWLPPPNSPPGTTTGNPCGSQDPGQPRRCTLGVINPAPTGGGVDAHTVVVVSDQDFKSFNDQVTQLKQQLSDRARKAMQDHAQGDVFAIDPSQQGLTLSTEVAPPVPNSGDEYKETMITVTVHGRAAAYNPDEVRRVFTTDLSAQIPQGETLVEQRLTGPDIQQASDDGTVVFSIRGTGFSQPIVDLNKLKETFTGQAQDAVGRKVRSEFGDQASTSISRAIPFFVLPFFSSRISVDVRVVAEGSS
ncbi:MAG: hypothetical protein QOG45_2844, partial [Chloroflexota bacterium]|nr:hypothetical protein [Chloroflexota bacterium]